MQCNLMQYNANIMYYRQPSANDIINCKIGFVTKNEEQAIIARRAYITTARASFQKLQRIVC
jgi:hypothetical protein